MIEKNNSRKFLKLLEKRIYETNRDLEKVEDKLEALLVKKRQLHLHVVGICDKFACQLSVGPSQTEKKKMSGFFYAVEGIWKRDRAPDQRDQTGGRKKKRAQRQTDQIGQKGAVVNPMFFRVKSNI